MRAGALRSRFRYAAEDLLHAGTAEDPIVDFFPKVKGLLSALLLLTEPIRKKGNGNFRSGILYRVAAGKLPRTPRSNQQRAQNAIINLQGYANDH